tara:strand:- start:114 stop:542 length:429 start_codon:yes stop_codon:yes gene_type:complete
MLYSKLKLMIKELIGGLLLLSIVWMGCKGDSKPDPNMQKAFETHSQYLQVAEESQLMLDKLPEDDSIRLILEKQLNEWSQNIIEVPGFEHEYHHHYGHHHHGQDDSHTLLSAGDMLIVQKELLDSVRAIKQRIVKQESPQIH